MKKILYVFFYLLLPMILSAKTNLIVFHAGSLSVPFMRIEKAFEKENPDVDIKRVIGGSRKLARMIVDVGKYADVFASADYSLIDNMMIPKFAKKDYRFASNEMVIAYTNSSKYSKIINSNNWYKILLKKDVKYGHSSPDLDPCGYRSIIVLKLAEKYYKIPGFFSKVTKDKSRIIIRPKEVDLTPLLLEGFIDYFFIYKSVAIQHHLKFIKLPDKINLSKLKFNNFYSLAKVRLSGKKPGKYVYKKGKAIIYGITILKMSKHKKLAKKFLDFLLDKNKGGKIIEESGQNFIMQLY